VVNRKSDTVVARRPVRVLHVTEDLIGGGSQRWIWDIVRLSNPRRTAHRVVAVQPDLGRFVYGERLRQVGAFGTLGTAATPSPVSRRVHRLLTVGLSRLPSPYKRQLAPVWHAAVVLPMALAALVREYRRFQPDVIHAHLQHGFTIGLLLKAITRRPLVHTVPSSLDHMADAGFGWIAGLYARFHPLVDRFFAAYFDELAALGIPRAKMFPTRGAIDIPAVDALLAHRQAQRSGIRRSLGIPDESLIALTVGRLDECKGHAFTVEALPELVAKAPSTHLVILGEGSQRPLLEARLRELGVADHAHLVGFVDDPLPWYAAADIYLRTPIFEAENLSSLPALGFGLPVVGFDTAVETELIDKIGHGVLVPNRDPSALAHAAGEILASPDRGRAMGRRGAEYGRANLDIMLTVNDLQDTYVELVARRRTAVGSRYPAPGRQLERRLRPAAGANERWRRQRSGGEQ
jgi:glycosyltransferase involved in cell wall biosynthesis